MTLSNANRYALPSSKHHKKKKRANVEDSTNQKALVLADLETTGLSETPEPDVSETAPQLHEITETLTLPGNPSIPEPGPVELPLYLRDPGPPPKLPRRLEVRFADHASYRIRGVDRTNTHRKLLWSAAALGVVLLFVLIVIKPQNKPILSFNSQTQASVIGTDIAINQETKPVISDVQPYEQFGVVTVSQVMVREEPDNNSTAIKSLSRMDYTAFKRKISTGWYLLKDGTGWIEASAVQTYQTEQEARDAAKALNDN
ncbi:MAG TPA: hypothetical protein VH186_19175 [Chloroflexia bacterium]|nr:hypothetical protein [Chloroflexia bacterium]